MTYAPTNPLDVPPYQLQSLISNVLDGSGRESSTYHNDVRVKTNPVLERLGLPGLPVQIRCAQALGSEIYVGCSNGELMRFALQANNPTTPESYTLLSRQSVTNDRPIQEIVLLPSLSRALVLGDHQVFIYTLPSLDMIPSTVIKPIRNVVTIAVDEQHLRRPALNDPSQPVEPVEFCVIKRNAIALYSLREKLFFQKSDDDASELAGRFEISDADHTYFILQEIPLPTGGSLARRTGRYLCVADKDNYNTINLEAASFIPLMPVSQAPDGPAVKPSITVISEYEFLILSWTGASTLGVFITGEGEPVRGTLEWSSHPQSQPVLLGNLQTHMDDVGGVAVTGLDYPYITALLPNGTVDIHNIETQAIMQVLSAPANSPMVGVSTVEDRKGLVACASGFLMPSSQRSDKLRRTAVRLVRRGGERAGGDTGEGDVAVAVI
ncbi:uncharacterized protein FIBRA_08259 [Fibroporia radiculosa]|uniref:CNH domain-containing protein n=1 Tax=Fibroporia radiculosa TaxID=599839 RepID=J4GWG8_9APHY|nr:uncharacterized protein FIBRA_08259 [Fibroporia radiculosa]CCM06015.1 predicted protein [Fibroporia radiculosa]